MKTNIGLFIIIVLPFISCGPYENSNNCHHKITIVNNYKTAIYVDASYLYPDTIDFHYSGLKDNAHIYKILSNKQSDKPLNILRDCWEIQFKTKSILPSDTLMIYVFDAEIIENIPWSTIANGYMILKRYDLSLEDLAKLNWTITYPPTEEMKNIKMYPPYRDK
jgi:hypothetical protein